jgi:hypothetical protein
MRSDWFEFAASPLIGRNRAPCAESSGSQGKGIPNCEDLCSSGLVRTMFTTFAAFHNPSSKEGFSTTSDHKPPYVECPIGSRKLPKTVAGIGFGCCGLVMRICTEESDNLPDSVICAEDIEIETENNERAVTRVCSEVRVSIIRDTSP